MHPKGDSGHANVGLLKSLVPKIPHAHPKGLCAQVQDCVCSSQRVGKSRREHVVCCCHICSRLQPCKGILTVRPFFKPISAILLPGRTYLWDLPLSATHILPFSSPSMHASNPLLCCLLVRRLIGADCSRNTAALHTCAWPCRSAHLTNQGIVPKALHCGGLAAEPHMCPQAVCASVNHLSWILGRIALTVIKINQIQLQILACIHMSSCNIWSSISSSRHLAGPQAVFLANCQHKLQHNIIPINQYIVYHSVFLPSRRPSSYFLVNCQHRLWHNIIPIKSRSQPTKKMSV